MTKRAIAGLLADGVLAACAPASVTMGKLPAIASAADAGEVVVVRERGFIANDFSYYVNVDHENIVAIAAGEHTRFKLPAGEHRIAIRCYAPLDGSWNETVLTERIAAQRTLYLQVAPKAGCASIEALSEGEAKKRLARTDLKEL